MEERPEGIWGALGEVDNGPGRTSSDVGHGFAHVRGSKPEVANAPGRSPDPYLRN